MIEVLQISPLDFVVTTNFDDAGVVAVVVAVLFLRAVVRVAEVVVAMHYHD